MTEYTWPRIKAIHPDHGSHEMDVHCVRTNGSLVLVAFAANTRTKARQVELIWELADGMGAEILPLKLSNITTEVAIALASTLMSGESSMAVLEVEQRERSASYDCLD
jgi:hypothetical protein